MDPERRWADLSAGRGTTGGRSFFVSITPMPLLRPRPVLHDQQGDALLVPEEDAIDEIPANYDHHRKDYRPTGKKICTPKLSLLGGKVERGDDNPVATALREAREETGRKMPRVDEAHVLALVKKNRLFAEYMPNAKALIIFYQVPAEQRDAWDALPQKYKEEFKGTVDAPSGRSAERKRSAQRLHWVPCPAGLGPSCPRVRPGPDACAIRCCRQQCALRPLLWKGSARLGVLPRGTRSSRPRSPPAVAVEEGTPAQHHRGGAGGAGAPVLPGGGSARAQLAADALGPVRRGEAPAGDPRARRRPVTPAGFNDDDSEDDGAAEEEAAAAGGGGGEAARRPRRRRRRRPYAKEQAEAEEGRRQQQRSRPRRRGAEAGGGGGGAPRRREGGGEEAAPADRSAGPAARHGRLVGQLGDRPSGWRGRRSTAPGGGGGGGGGGGSSGGGRRRRRRRRRSATPTRKAARRGEGKAEAEEAKATTAAAEATRAAEAEAARLAGRRRPPSRRGSPEKLGGSSKAARSPDSFRGPLRRPRPAAFRRRCTSSRPRPLGPLAQAARCP